MDCNRSNDLMNLALDSMLDEEELNEFKAHIEDCDICKETYHLYQSINADLSVVACEADLPDGFHESLMNRINTSHNTQDESVSSSQVLPLWRRINRRTMNVAAVFALVVVFALVGVKSLNQLGVTDEGAVMNEMSADTDSFESDMMDESASVEKASPKDMDVAVERDLATKEINEANDDSVDVVDGQTSETSPAAEMATMMITDDPETNSGSGVAEEEAQLSMVAESPQLARMEEAEVSSYKGNDQESLALRESKTYTNQGSIEGQRYLVWLIFGGFVLVTGLGGFLIVRKMK